MSPGGRTRLRSRVGGRAPFPRRVFALLVARGIPHRGGGADAAHSRRPRRGRVRAGDESSDPRRRTRRGARHHFERPARIRHRAFVDVDRTRRFLGEPRRHQEDVGRIRSRAAADVDERRVRMAGQSVLDAVAQRVAEAVSAAASADVGDGDHAGHRTRRGRPRSRLPRRVCRRVRRTGAPDEGVSPAHQTVRTRWRHRQRSGAHDELPVLPRGLSRGARHRRADGEHLQHRQCASVLDARSVSDARVSDARQRRRRDERQAAACGRSERCKRSARRRWCGRPGSPRAHDQTLGSRSASPASIFC